MAVVAMPLTRILVASPSALALNVKRSVLRTVSARTPATKIEIPASVPAVLAESVLEDPIAKRKKRMARPIGTL
jgi:hypothetical protein